MFRDVFTVRAADAVGGEICMSAAKLAAVTVAQLTAAVTEAQLSLDETTVKNDAISVVFEKQGSLGLNLCPRGSSTTSGKCYCIEQCAGMFKIWKETISQRMACGFIAMVLGIQQDAQAAEHVQIKPGLVVTMVGATSTAGLTYSEVADVIAAHPMRPLTMVFQADAES